MDGDYEARFAENSPEAAFEQFMKSMYNVKFVDVTSTSEISTDSEEGK